MLRKRIQYIAIISLYILKDLLLINCRVSIDNIYSRAKIEIYIDETKLYIEQRCPYKYILYVWPL